MREALEYALDKQAIHDAIGYGRLLPHLCGFSSRRVGRATRSRSSATYDPEKAKALLTEAGYANGCPITSWPSLRRADATPAQRLIKGYLDAAGFVTTSTSLIPAGSTARCSAPGGKAWPSCSAATTVTYLMSCCAWWGPNPKTNLASFQRPEDFKALFEPAMSRVPRKSRQQRPRTSSVHDTSMPS